jgi:hypothetical protein
MKAARIAIAVGGVLAVTAAVSYARVHLSADDAMEFREANVAAYYRYGVVPDTIVFDIWSVEGTASAAGILGGFMSFAEKMKDREFRQVVLAYRGEARFILDGNDFAEIGREHGWQNPVYTLRTFPERLTTPDGSPAFSTWSGGMIGVLGAQMDDLNKLASAWYIDDEIRRH